MIYQTNPKVRFLLPDTTARGCCCFPCAQSVSTFYSRVHSHDESQSCAYRVLPHVTVVCSHTTSHSRVRTECCHVLQSCALTRRVTVVCAQNVATCYSRVRTECCHVLQSCALTRRVTVVCTQNVYTCYSLVRTECCHMLVTVVCSHTTSHSRVRTECWHVFQSCAYGVLPRVTVVCTYRQTVIGTNTAACYSLHASGAGQDARLCGSAQACLHACTHGTYGCACGVCACVCVVMLSVG